MSEKWEMIGVKDGTKKKWRKYKAYLEYTTGKKITDDQLLSGILDEKLAEVPLGSTLVPA